MLTFREKVNKRILFIYFRERACYTQRNRLSILVKSNEIRLYLPFFDWFGAKGNSVYTIQISHKKYWPFANQTFHTFFMKNIWFFFFSEIYSNIQNYIQIYLKFFQKKTFRNSDKTVHLVTIHIHVYVCKCIYTYIYMYIYETKTNVSLKFWKLTNIIYNHRTNLIYIYIYTHEIT